MLFLKIPPHLTQAWNETMQPYYELCKQEAGSEELQYTNFIENGDTSDSPNFKCFLKCIAVKLQFLNDKGKFDTKKVSDTMKGVTSEMSTDCHSMAKNKGDLCEQTYLYAQCCAKRLVKAYADKVN